VESKQAYSNASPKAGTRLPLQNLFLFLVSGFGFVLSSGLDTQESSMTTTWNNGDSSLNETLAETATAGFA